MRFAERVRGLRRAKGLTKSALAKRARLRVSSIHRYEIGKDEDARYSSLEALAEALDATVEYLRGNDRQLAGESFEEAAARLSFMRFAQARPNLSTTQRKRFEMVANNPDAPRTTADWNRFDALLQTFLGPKSPLAYKGARTTRFRRQLKFSKRS